MQEKVKTYYKMEVKKNDRNIMEYSRVYDTYICNNTYDFNSYISNSSNNKLLVVMIMIKEKITFTINDVPKLKKDIEQMQKKYQQQIDQLTNNWNELRQHIKEYLKEWENSDDEWVKGKCDMASDILYDMEEIKGDKE